MASPAVPVTPAPKVSFWKHLCNGVGKVLGFIIKEEPKIQEIAVPALKQAFPSLGILIDGAAAVATKVVNELVAVQTLSATVAQQPTGLQRFDSVLANSAPVIDGWVQSGFPGAAAVSAANKSKLIQAFHDILEEIDPNAAPAPPAAG